MSLAALSLGGNILGGLLGGYGQYREGQANKAMHDYQAAVGQMNARYAEAKGIQDEGISRERTAQMIGAQRAGFAANGIRSDRGTAARVQGDTAQLGEIDAQTIRDNAARAAYAYRSGAAMETYAGHEAEVAGRIGAVSSLIGGASSAGAKWSSFQNAGVT